jgi:hypothetical protein
MSRFQFRSNKSGQLLIVAALAIAIIISSTTTFVYELTNYTTRADEGPSIDFVLAIKQSTRNAITSSLANISNGGSDTALSTNLHSLSTTIRKTQQFGLCDLAFNPKTNSNYNAGVRLSWQNGSGISSLCANFTVTVYSDTGKVIAPYSLNVTSSITVNGSYFVLQGNQKRVNLTIKLLNEDNPATASDITAYYDILGNWTQINSLNHPLLTDYGVGVYKLEFTVDTTSPSIHVATCVHDSRDIFMRANQTCNLA